MTRFVNNIKTTMLLALMFGLILLVGSFFGSRGVIIAFILGGLMNVFAFFFSDKIAVASMGGQLVDESSNVGRDLLVMVRRLAKNADLPMPKVYICPQDAPNAFATGRSPNHAAVAVTHGALRLLDYEELEGVIAHELAHIKNRDTLISTVAATVVGAINALWWVALLGGGNRDAHPMAMLAMVILGPLAAGMIHMAISRSREYVADADGAHIAGTPDGLIGALQKLDAVAQRVPLKAAPTSNHMMIVQPLNAAAGGGISRLFSTHPPVQDRIAKLRELA